MDQRFVEVQKKRLQVFALLLSECDHLFFQKGLGRAFQAVPRVQQPAIHHVHVAPEHGLWDVGAENEMAKGVGFQMVLLPSPVIGLLDLVA